MLKHIYTCLTVGLVSTTLAQESMPIPSTAPIAGVDKTIPAMALLPPGSVLTQVSLPRYKGPELDMLMTSPKMVIVTKQQIQGETVFIYIYDQGKIKSLLTSKKASYFLDREMVESQSETQIRDSRIKAKGTGLYFDPSTKKGILLGPVVTEISLPTKKTK